MSLEDQYDAWVRSVTGTGRHSATKQDRDAAQNSLNAMQAQLDALAESQKRQKSAANALNAVQRAGTATADSVRRMSSELTQSLRQDGLLGGKTAQPAPAAEPVKAGPENFNGLADRVRQLLGIDFHQTTPDGAVTLEPVYCLGLCACAPAAMLDDDLHGRLDADCLETLVAEVRR